MLDLNSLNRYTLDIKDSSTYLFDKFLRTCNELADKEWKLTVDLYCNTGITSFVFMYEDIIKREHVKIEGYSDAEFTEITQARLDMVFYEYDNLYSIGLYFDEENDYDQLLELNSNIPDLINESEMFSDYWDIVQKFKCLSEISLKHMCAFIKSLVKDGKLEISEVEQEEGESNNTCCYYEGNTIGIKFQIKIDDEMPFSDGESTYEKYYMFDDIHEEDVHDCLIVTFYESFRIIYKGRNVEDIRELVPEENTEPEVGVEDFLVRISDFHCINRDHHLTKVKALVHIDTGYRIVDYQANAMFCPECDQYYITEAEYSRVESIGRICCKLVTVEEYRKIHSSKYDTWAEQSLLRSYGYTVNANDNLSAKQRQRILSFIIENDIMSIRRVIDFISWLISKPGGYNLENARRKWQDDIDYLQHYVPATNVVVAGSFTKKKYKYQ